MNIEESHSRKQSMRGVEIPLREKYFSINIYEV